MALPKQVHLIVDAAWEPVGSQWQDGRLVSSELSAVGSRRIYTLNRESTDDRLVIRALFVPRNADGATALSVPFFALQENLSVSRTLALSSVGRSRWRLVGNEFWSRLASSPTEMGWESSKPTPSDAWRVPTGSLNGTLQRIAAAPRPVVDEKCELQLLSTATVLNYRADWTQAAEDQIAKFEYPAAAVVESVTINGAAAEYQQGAAGDRRYLLVRTARSATEIRSIEIRLTSDPLKTGAALPRVLLQDVAVNSSQYQISCGSELVCSIVNAASNTEDALQFSRPVQDSTLMLSTLTAPVGVAELGNRLRDSVYLPANVEMKNRKPIKLLANVMGLSRSEQGWRATVEAVLESSDEVSFVFFDVPSSIRDLIESTGSPFRVSAAGGAGRSTLCLLPRLGEDGKSRVSFTFRLSALGSSQSLAIPDLSFMGERATRPVLALPKTIDEQPVQWSRAGRRLSSDWLAKSGVSLARDAYVCFELSEGQQQTSWRPAQLDGKLAEVLFQWATIDQDPQGHATGELNYWIDPNNHLDVVAVLPPSAELIGVQSGSGGAVWHREANNRLRLLMQPSYLPVHVRMLLKWNTSLTSNGADRTSLLEMPVIEASGTRRMPVAIASSAALQSVRLVKQGAEEQTHAPETTELEAAQFDAMLADRWSKLLLKTLPVVSDLDGEELASWLRDWSPGISAVRRTQGLTKNADPSAPESDADGKTVGEFWDWYLDQLSDFDVDVVSAIPPTAEMREISSRLGLKASDVVEADVPSSTDAKWYVVDCPESSEQIALELVETRKVPNAFALVLPLVALLSASTGVWFVVRKLSTRMGDFLAQQPWIYWLVLAAACWLFLPSVLPSALIALCALAMTVSQLATTRRRQLALRRQ